MDASLYISIKCNYGIVKAVLYHPHQFNQKVMKPAEMIVMSVVSAFSHITAVISVVFNELVYS